MQYIEVGHRWRHVAHDSIEQRTSFHTNTFVVYKTHFRSNSVPLFSLQDYSPNREELNCPGDCGVVESNPGQLYFSTSKDASSDDGSIPSIMAVDGGGKLRLPSMEDLAHFANGLCSIPEVRDQSECSTNERYFQDDAPAFEGFPQTEQLTTDMEGEEWRDFSTTHDFKENIDKECESINKSQYTEKVVKSTVDMDTAALDLRLLQEDPHLSTQTKESRHVRVFSQEVTFDKVELRSAPRRGSRMENCDSIRGDNQGPIIMAIAEIDSVNNEPGIFFTRNDPTSPLIIDTICENGLFSDSLLVPGMVVKAINGREMMWKSPREAADELKPTNKSRKVLITAEAFVATIFKLRKSQLVGISLKKVNNVSGMVISEIHQDGLLCSSDLKPGMVLLSINEVECYKKTIKESINYIKSLQGEIRLIAANMNRRFAKRPSEGKRQPQKKYEILETLTFLSDQNYESDGFLFQTDSEDSEDVNDHMSFESFYLDL